MGLRRWLGLLDQKPDFDARRGLDDRLADAVRAAHNGRGAPVVFVGARAIPTGAAALRGPMTEQALRELQARNDQKRQAAIAALGHDWILHPTNRVR
jgi:hypothetical protein